MPHWRVSSARRSGVIVTESQHAFFPVLIAALPSFELQQAAIEPFSVAFPIINSHVHVAAVSKITVRYGMK